MVTTNPPEGRAAKREDQLLDALRAVILERETLKLEVGLLKAEQAINKKKRR